MKPAFYLLLAMGTMACADVLDGSTTVTDDTPVALTMENVDYFSVTVALNSQAIAADLATDDVTGKTELFSVNDDGKNLSFGLIDSGSDALQLYTPTGSGSLDALAWDDTTYPDGAPDNSVWAQVEKAVLTVVYPFGEPFMGIIPPTNALAQFTLELQDGTTINYSANGIVGNVGSPFNLTSFSINSDYVLQGWIQEIDAAKTYSDFMPTLNAINEKAIEIAPSASSAVPEPTTATLSLLALAGLAARRRRK